MTDYVVAQVADIRHAVPAEGGVALCGVQPHGEASGSWPGSGGGLCRECSRLVAGSAGVPFTTGRRRPGGMG
jgi:hypothetical protein